MSSKATLPRFRPALVLVRGLPLALAVGYLILRMEQPENYATPTGLTLCYPVVVALAVIVLLNQLVPVKHRLTRPELLALYTLMGLSGAFVCWENLGILVPSLMFPAALPGRSEPGSDWLATARATLPTWALPLELTAPKSSLWRTPLFWLGFALAAGLDIWNGLATFYPSLPLIPLKVQWWAGDSLSPGWAALGRRPGATLSAAHGALCDSFACGVWPADAQPGVPGPRRPLSRNLWRLCTRANGPHSAQCALLGHALPGRTTPPNATTITELLVGGILTLGLILLRRVWITSPFNPVGFAISGSWNTMMVAVPLFLAWLLKALVLRYGGLSTYRAAIPLALGVVCGEFLVETFWEVFALATGLQPYRIWMF